MKNCNEYALYRGDKLLAIGTAKEIAKELGITERVVRHYSSPAYIKRTSERARRLIKIGDENDFI